MPGPLLIGIEMKRFTILTALFVTGLLAIGGIPLSTSPVLQAQESKVQKPESDDEDNASSSPMVVSVEIPQKDVSEYHRPYVAIWVQDENDEVAANLSVWYQLNKGRRKSGTKWLPDLRQWWRRSGRKLDLPVDGVSGATRPVGTHELPFDTDGQLAKLKAGKYTLVVEAAREVGGRELVEIPFAWPPAEETTLEKSGKSELGKVQLKLKPEESKEK